MDKTKFCLPIAILLASIILGGFYYASHASNQDKLKSCLNTAQYLSGTEYDKEREFCVKAYK